MELCGDLASGEPRIKVDAHAGGGEGHDPALPATDREDRADVELGVVLPHLGETGDLVHAEQLDQLRVPLAERLGRRELAVERLADLRTDDRLLETARELIAPDQV